MEKINTPTGQWAKGITNGLSVYENMFYPTLKKNGN